MSKRQQITCELSECGKYLEILIPLHNGKEHRTIPFPLDTAGYQIARLLENRAIHSAQVGTPTAPTIAQAIAEAMELRKQHGLKPVAGEAFEATKQNNKLAQEKKRADKRRREIQKEMFNQMTDEEKLHALGL